MRKSVVSRGLSALWAVMAWGLLLMSTQVAADTSGPRVALIVGNASYGALEPLDNPVSDAELMARTLSQQGFEVTLIMDADQIQLNRAIASFGRDLRDAGRDATGLFYYAGHAVQSFGNNYLLPVDASLTDAADLSLVAVNAQAVLQQMFSARNQTNIVIFDACRNNPFATIPDMIDNGLAEMRAPTGTFLSYSTAPGAVALDGTDGNSPFTKALAREIPASGLPIEQVFKNVRIKVLEETGGQQTPWDTSSLTSNFVFNAGLTLSEDATTPSAPTQDTTATQEQMIAAAQASGSAQDFQAYLDRFPQGVYAEYAAFELSVIAEKARRAAGQSGDDTVVAAATTSRAAGVAMGPELTWTMPFTNGGETLEGKSIAELVKAFPDFPPIEGLPETLWKEQDCAACHQWTPEALCDQGVTYLNDPQNRALSKPHPFGGVFKANVRSWAEGGCK